MSMTVITEGFNDVMNCLSPMNEISYTTLNELNEIFQ